MKATSNPRAADCADEEEVGVVGSRAWSAG